ncbi:Huntingtin [Trichinella pseudospiralis]|uniref:Huntingtin n=1 Tax=Trichinella pseudospiralis TaxID=6337 RepID=A0A0V1KFE1_TRIPS|nr:Huntingtin [Trichinella pseudospiralis]
MANNLQRQRLELRVREIGNELSEMLDKNTLNKTKMRKLLEELRTYGGIDVDMLVSTNIGKTVNRIRITFVKCPELVENATFLVKKWKKEVNALSNSGRRKSLSKSTSQSSDDMDQSPTSELCSQSTTTFPLFNLSSPVRQNSCRVLFDSIRSNLNSCRTMFQDCDTNLLSDDNIKTIVQQIEASIYELNGSDETNSKYGTVIRSHAMNLCNSKNCQLLRDILTRKILPANFAKMSTEEMAPEELKNMRKAMERESLKEHMLSSEDSLLHSTAFHCRQCGQRDCNYTVSYEKEGHEAEAVTYVVCNQCGHRMEKLMKNLESLRRPTNMSKKEAVPLSKEKAALFYQVAEALSSNTLKQHAEYGKAFGNAFSILFSYCDDPCTDVRILTEETMNIIIRSCINEWNISRVHSELCKELKRNGSARCIRSAMGKFVETVELIGIQKRRYFAITLIPLFEQIIKRPEEMIQDCIGSTIGRLLQTLGRYFRDEEIHGLVHSALANLQLQSTLFRRVAATFITELCHNSRRRSDMISYWFRYILTKVTKQACEDVFHLLGNLLTLKMFIPLVLKEHQIDQQESKNVGQRVKQISNENFVQLCEAVLFYTAVPNDVVNSLALEMLVKIFENCTQAQCAIWLRNDSVKKSRFFFPTTVDCDSTNTPDVEPMRSESISSASVVSCSEDPAALQQDTVEQPVLNISFQGDDCLEKRIQRFSASSDDQSQFGERESLESICIDRLKYSGLQRSVEAVDERFALMEMDEEARSNQQHSNERKIDEQSHSFSTFASISGASVHSGKTPAFDKLTTLTVADWAKDEFDSLLAETTSMAQFCCRLICRRFLLTGQAGVTLPDEKIRVSHKVLSLAALERLFTLDHALYNLSLYEGCLQNISDVVLLCKHLDPQVRGFVAQAVASLLISTATAVQSRKWNNDDDQEFKEEMIVLKRFFEILSNATRDESNVCIHYTLSSLRRTFSIMQKLYPSEVVNCAHNLLRLASNPYWLVKVKLAECFEELDFCLISSFEKTCHSNLTEKLQPAVLHCLIDQLLLDEDRRVSSAASTSLLKLIPRLYFFGNVTLVSLNRQYYGCTFSGRQSWLHPDLPTVHNSVLNYSSQADLHYNALLIDDTEHNLSIVIDLLYSTFYKISADVFDWFGCIVALDELAIAYPPRVYRRAWSTTIVNGKHLACPLMQHCLQLLRTDCFQLDPLISWQRILHFVSTLFTACVVDFESQPTVEATNEEKKKKKKTTTIVELYGLTDIAADLIAFTMQITSMYWHVVEQRPPLSTARFVKSGGTSNTTLSSPVIKKLKYPNFMRKEINIKLHLGRGDSSVGERCGGRFSEGGGYEPQLLNLFEILRRVGSNFRATIDAETEKKFLGLLESALQALSAVLEAVSVVAYTHKRRVMKQRHGYLEDFLFFSKSLMPLMPAQLISTLTQVIKVLFGTNLHFEKQLKVKRTQDSIVNQATTLQSCADYEHFLENIQTHISQKTACSMMRHDFVEDSLMCHVGWLENNYSQYVSQLFQDSERKSFLSEAIQLFEPILMEGLRMYTVQSDGRFQAAFVGLICHLLLVKVNYSVLDPQRRILNLFCQQLEHYIEDDSCVDREFVCKLFELLIILSHERQNTVPFVEIPKIIQLVESMYTSKDNPLLGNIAMHYVVLDLFLLRQQGVGNNELEIQQEVVIAMLTKALQYAESWDSFNIIMFQLKKFDERRWRKISRDLTDRLLPLLLEGKIEIKNSNSVNALYQLLDMVCSRAYSPVDPIFSAFCFLAAECEHSTLNKWKHLLAVTCLLRILFLHCPGDSLLDRANEVLPTLKANQQQQLAVWMNDDHTDTKPEELIVRLILCLSECFLVSLVDSAVAVSSNSRQLELQLIVNFYETIFWINQSGMHPKLAAVFRFEEHFGRIIDQLEIASRTGEEVVLFQLCHISAALCNSEWHLNELISRLQIKSFPWLVILVTCNKDLLKNQMSKSTTTAATTTMDSLFLKWSSLNLERGTCVEEAAFEELFKYALKMEHNCETVLYNFKRTIDSSSMTIAQQLKMVELLKYSCERFSLIALHLEICLVQSKHYLVRRCAEQSACRRVLSMISKSTQELQRMTGVELLLKDIIYATSKNSFTLLFKNAELRSLLVKFVNDSLHSAFGLSQRLPSELSSRAVAAFSDTGHSFDKLDVLHLLKNDASPDVGAYADRWSRFAKAVQCFPVEDVRSILCDQKIPGAALRACLKLARRRFALSCDSDQNNRGVAPEKEFSRNMPKLFTAGKEAVIFALQNLIRQFPADAVARFQFSQWEVDLTLPIGYREKAFSMHSSVQELFSIISAASWRLSTSEISVILDFVHISFLTCLKLLPDLSLHEATATLATFLTVLANQHCCTFFTDQPQNVVHSIIGCTFWMLVKSFRLSALLRRLPSKLPFTQVNETEKMSFLYCEAMLSFRRSRRLYEQVQDALISDTIIGVCRLPQVFSFCLSPFAAFPFGWVPDVKRVGDLCTFSNVPVRFLVHADVLKDFIYRVCLLGWSSKQQFEEIWMTLVAVLSATPIGKEMSHRDRLDTVDRVTASSLAVRCIGCIFMMTSPRLVLTPVNNWKRATQFRPPCSFQSEPTWNKRCAEIAHLVKFELESSSNLEMQADLQLPCSFCDVEKLYESAKLLNRAQIINSNIASGGSIVTPNLRESFDLVSCMYFVIDLFDHWFKDGPDQVPLLLLISTLDAIVCLSDFFFEDAHSEWMTNHMNVVFQARSADDEFITNVILFGILKCAANLCSSNAESLKMILQVVDHGCKISFQSNKMFMLFGLLQSLRSFPSADVACFLPNIGELILHTFQLMSDRETVNNVQVCGLDYEVACCALACQMMEKLADEHGTVDYLKTLLKLAAEAYQSPLPHCLQNAVATVLQTLLRFPAMNFECRQQILTVTTKCFDVEPGNSYIFTSLTLMLISLHFIKNWFNNQADDDEDDDDQQRQQLDASASDHHQSKVTFHIMVMERFDIILRKIAQSATEITNILGVVCCEFLKDNFSPSDVIHKLVLDFMNSMKSVDQQKVLIDILCSVLKDFQSKDEPTIFNWILLLVPSIVEKRPSNLAISCLTCFFLSIFRESWMEALRIIALNRLGKMEEFDAQLFAFTVKRFKELLPNETLVNDFLAIFANFSIQYPNTAYSLAHQYCMTKKS